MIILGLDISSTTTAYTILVDGKIVECEPIKLNKLKTFLTKADLFNMKMMEISEKYPKIDRIFVEEPLKAFKGGFSSASTIASLTRINGVCSWIVYKIWNVVPEYISAATARKIYGVKADKLNNENNKDAALRTVIDKEPDFAVSYNRNNNINEFCKDMADSLVIARAGEVICQRQEVIPPVLED